MPTVARKAEDGGGLEPSMFPWEQNLCPYCGAHLLESYCKESNISDTN